MKTENIKRPHLDWWHSLTASEHFALMRKYEVKQVNNKLIKRMWSGEFVRKPQVFRFAKNGNVYTVKAPTIREARQFLKSDHDVDIHQGFEVSEAEWDEKTIKAMRKENLIELICCRERTDDEQLRDFYTPC